MARSYSKLLASLLRADLWKSSRSSSFKGFSGSATRTIASHTHAQHAESLSRLSSSIDTNSDAYRQNVRDMDEVMSLFKERHGKVQEGGSAKAKEKHVARGKMLPREYWTCN